MKNWKTTWSKVGVAVMSLLTVLSLVPANMGELSDLIPPEWKKWTLIVAFLSTFVLRIISGIVSADAKPKPPTNTDQ